VIAPDKSHYYRAGFKSGTINLTEGTRTVAAELHVIVSEDQQLNEKHVISRVHGWLNLIPSFRFDTMLTPLRRCHQAFQSFPLPEAVEFRLKLRRLQREKSRLYDLYARAHEEYRRLDADDEEIKQLNYEERYNVGIVDEQIYQVHFERITAHAERLSISIPDHQQNREHWEVAPLTGRWRLRREALRNLLTAIREVQKERQQAMQAKLIWVTAATGMMGALTGLMSVLHR
jgi:hypothetical protein